MRKLVRDFVKKDLKKSLPKASITKVVGLAALFGFAVANVLVFLAVHWSFPRSLHKVR